MDDLLRDFLTETGEHLDTVDIELVRFEQDPNDARILANIFRLVHTIKGTCGFLGLPRLGTLTHAAESAMARLRDGAPVTHEVVGLILATIDRVKAILAELDQAGAEPNGDDSELIDALAALAAKGGPAAMPLPRAAPEPEAAAADIPDSAAPRGEDAARPAPPAAVPTIRVAVDTIEHLMTMVSELVLTRNQLLEIARHQEDGALKTSLQRLSHVTVELQESVMKTRMQPIGTAWQKLPRIMRDLSAELGKQIELVMIGAETELDRQVLELIRDPLTHMVRNAADHGIEPPLVRRAAGKPEHGTVRLSAFHEGGTITIEISDDGRGLDYAAIRRKAADLRLLPEADIDRMSDAQVAKFILHPGFSTRNVISAISGRGVGMDVVQSNIETIGGAVEIRSEPGAGTTFTLKIPLTLAIVAALVVNVRDHRFAIPQVAVLELVRVKAGGEHVIERIHQTPVLRLRDRLLPIVRLDEALGLGTRPEGQPEEGFIVVTQVGRERFGILVDGLFHTEEIVVKPMAAKLRHLPLFSGNTILGDGAVVLIIDPNGLAKVAGSSGAASRLILDEMAEPEIERAKAVTLLVFRGGDKGCKAVPLSLVTRLESIEATRIETVGGRRLVQYRGRLMPLVPVDSRIAVPEEGGVPVLVFADGERAMGLIVEEIVDIVDEAVEIDPATGRPDIVGSAIVRGVATDIVDIGHFLPIANDGWRRGEAGRQRRRSVLLVDDSPFFREMLTPVIRAAGYAVETAADGAHAVERIGAGRAPDILVIDSDLSGESGLALAERVRALPAGAELPIIALGTLPGRGMLAEARRLGISEFVAKFDRSGLVAALAEAEAPLGEAA